jgi:dihydropteroate synthase
VKDTSFYGKFQLNIKGRLVSFEQPVVMGILNVTPDSFYAGSRIRSDDDLTTQAAVMLNEGAEILDIGGYSSRPGSDDISVAEEIERSCKAVSLISSKFPDALLSVDTFRSEVALRALENGAHMVNDISGGQLDDKMFSVVADFKVPYIMMHMRGTPQSMMKFTKYEDFIKDLLDFFESRIQLARAAGIHDIIIDPGFGFSKTTEQNFEVLRKLEMFHLYETPILVGLSRKSMIYKTLNISADESLTGTIMLNSYALNKGASILRVHDVKEAKETIMLHQAILGGG